MPANTKPVPWHEVRARYEAGEAENAIAAELTAKGVKISRQGIRKRRNKEGWKVNPSAAKVREAAAEWEPLATTHSGTGRQLATGPSRSSTQIANWGKRTPENAALILASLANHGDAKLAAKAAGIHPDTLKRWRESDADFAAQIDQAEAQWAQGRMTNVQAAGDRGDWRADQWLLQNNPATKDTYGANSEGGHGRGIVLNFNISRGAAPEEAEVIEVTPIKEE